jgi:hypothetical protein
MKNRRHMCNKSLTDERSTLMIQRNWFKNTGDLASRRAIGMNCNIGKKRG